MSTRFNKIREIRALKGLTQQAVAIRAGTGCTMMVAIEKYNYYPTPNMRQRLARAVGVSEETIWPAETDIEVA